MQGSMVVGLIVDIERRCKMCKRHWSTKYRLRSLGQDTCRVSTSRRSTKQGFVVEVLHRRRSGTLTYIMSKSLQPK